MWMRCHVDAAEDAHLELPVRRGKTCHARRLLLLPAAQRLQRAHDMDGLALCQAPVPMYMQMQIIMLEQVALGMEPQRGMHL